MSDDTPRKSHRSLTSQLWIFALCSFGFGFALVPLYSVICAVTGYGDRRQLEQAASATEAPDENRWITVEFMSAEPTVGEWEFRPEVTSIRIHPGKLSEVKFYAKNLRDQPATAQAIPSIAPSDVTKYFRKTECFCFSPQQFGPQQARDLVVRFVVDPKLPTDVDRITLAYSMFTVAAKTAQR